MTLLVGEQLTQSTTAPVPLAMLTQHVMNFGCSDPMPNGPTGGVRWSSLDDRVAMMRLKPDGSPRGIPWGLIACGSPKWMNAGGAQYEILPENHQAFADLIAAAARRYWPLEHVIVWNEMKGFWDGAHNRWNYEAYTDLYLKVYAAVKSVDPSIKVGGPYPELGADTKSRTSRDLAGPWGFIDARALDVLDYFFAHAANKFDFVTFDGHAAPKSGGAIPGDIYDTTYAYWNTLALYVKARTDKPVRVTELHVGQKNVALTPEQSATAYQAALDGLNDAGNVEVAFTWGNRSSGGIDSDGIVNSGGLTPAGKAIVAWNTAALDPKQAQIDALTAQVAQLQAQVADLATANEFQASGISALNAKLDAARSDLFVAQNNLAKVQADLA